MILKSQLINRLPYVRTIVTRISFRVKYQIYVLSTLPVCWNINTHVHPKNWFLTIFEIRIRQSGVDIVCDFLFSQSRREESFEFFLQIAFRLEKWTLSFRRLVTLLDFICLKWLAFFFEIYFNYFKESSFQDFF